VKTALKAELLEVLTATLASLERAHADTSAGATHAEAKPENDKDTRALEASYLARGQAMRIEELKLGRAALERMELPDLTGKTVSLGALVEAEEDEDTLRFFVAPEGGGTRLKGGVQVVTPRSPLGQALVGRREGDELELKLAGKTRTLVIAKVR
jgi:transcription elongation GreA/GreB family factor